MENVSDLVERTDLVSHADDLDSRKNPQIMNILIESAKDLPRNDVNDPIDSFCTITFCGVEQKTGVRKRSSNPGHRTKSSNFFGI